MCGKETVTETVGPHELELLRLGATERCGTSHPGTSHHTPTTNKNKRRNELNEFFDAELDRRKIWRDQYHFKGQGNASMLPINRTVAIRHRNICIWLDKVNSISESKKLPRHLETAETDSI